MRKLFIHAHPYINFKVCAMSEKQSQYLSSAWSSSVLIWYKNISTLQGLRLHFIGLWFSKLVAINSGKQSHQEYFYRVKWLHGTRSQQLSKIWRLLCCTQLFIKALKPCLPENVLMVSWSVLHLIALAFMWQFKTIYIIV